MKVGILTGGGDVPGLNPAIKAATTRLIGAGHEMVGIRKGWGGLLNFDPASPASPGKYTLKLDRWPCAKLTAPAAPSCTAAAPTPAT